MKKTRTPWESPGSSDGEKRMEVNGKAPETPTATVTSPGESSGKKSDGSKLKARKQESSARDDSDQPSDEEGGGDNRGLPYGDQEGNRRRKHLLCGLHRSFSITTRIHVLKKTIYRRRLVPEPKLKIDAPCTTTPSIIPCVSRATPWPPSRTPHNRHNGDGRNHAGRVWCRRCRRAQLVLFLYW